MIVYLEEYRRYIVDKGVGSNDKVASSPDSYVSYLNSVSKILGVDISPKILSTETDIISIASRLKDKRADSTIDNYKTAMTHYVAMVIDKKLR